MKCHCRQTLMTNCVIMSFSLGTCRTYCLTKGAIGSSGTALSSSAG